MKTKSLSLLMLLALASCGSGTQDQALPTWFEPDSATAIHNRLLYDFPKTLEEMAPDFLAKYTDLNEDSLRAYADAGYIETLTIDGVERVHRKALGNLALLHPRYRGEKKHRGFGASDARISFVDSVLRYTDGKLPDGNAHHVHFRFSVDVPYNEVLKDDTLRVWMPFPMPTERQSNIRLISASPEGYIVSEPEQSVHRSIYFSAPVVEGDTAHFEYEAEFITRGVANSPKDILRNMKPYDKDSELYKKYTAFETPHIVNLDSLAKAIVGDESNPYRQSELVYDFIIENYPWAGAREYSTIPCIPQYVVDSDHGDCGQVSLLYISLMRSLGVPARWESGWMLHPGEKNLHDWAEVYFEGTGWVPVDVSFGRYRPAPSEVITNFYSTGIDAHRFAANKGVCGEFFPPKRFIRSETVDAQMGEVETTRGNLFYPGWKRHLELISVTPVE